MFQFKSSDSQNLNQILNQELDSFNAVLQFSEKIIEQVEALPISALSQMVDYRQKWIAEIQKLEELRKKISDQSYDEDGKIIIENISGLARKLVDIDNQIYGQLKERKLKFVKEHADLISARRQNNKSNGLSRIMDIIQE